MHKNERLEAVMGEGGVADCGKAQNCVEVCPKEIPLVDSIAVVARETTKRMLSAGSSSSTSPRALRGLRRVIGLRGRGRYVLKTKSQRGELTPKRDSRS